MKILQSLDERAEELEETIDDLNKIFDNAYSEDIKDDISSLVLEYEKELQNINNRLAEEGKVEKRYMNLEYERSVI